jgi:hypothetical protein
MLDRLLSYGICSLDGLMFSLRQLFFALIGTIIFFLNFCVSNSRPPKEAAKVSDSMEAPVSFRNLAGIPSECFVERTPDTFFFFGFISHLYSQFSALSPSWPRSASHLPPEQFSQAQKYCKFLDQAPVPDVRVFFPPLLYHSSPLFAHVC